MALAQIAIVVVSLLFIGVIFYGTAKLSEE